MKLPIGSRKHSGPVLSSPWCNGSEPPSEVNPPEEKPLLWQSSVMMDCQRGVPHSTIVHCIHHLRDNIKQSGSQPSGKKSVSNDPNDSHGWELFTFFGSACRLIKGPVH
ncbi:hypothetical protein CEXT_348851 [Caerostris extrusa]|uniref:Uncharacterized protein n=1 Tax=Caerostris extrusa TaxID=172846 RepID=A0AAV4XPP4_CAEEX|nr:hypothetical protein CEXT_348851 [Caerostris extrusa]